MPIVFNPLARLLEFTAGIYYGLFVFTILRKWRVVKLVGTMVEIDRCPK